MPKPRAAKLETATARRHLAVRKKPYWTTISPGVGLGYRRCAGPGTWSVRSTDGHGSDWIKRIALADDFEPSDGRGRVELLAGHRRGEKARAPPARRRCRREPPADRRRSDRPLRP